VTEPCSHRRGVLVDQRVRQPPHRRLRLQPGDVQLHEAHRARLLRQPLPQHRRLDLPPSKNHIKQGPTKVSI
jgi:hypothetical protein